MNTQTSNNRIETETPTPNHSMQDQAYDAAGRVANSAMEIGQDVADHYVKAPAKDLFSLAKEYAKDNPDVAACWAFGLGIVIGWKIKP